MRIAAIGGGDKQPILGNFISELDKANAIIIPTACSTEASYNRKVPTCQDSLGALGLHTTVLHKFGETPTLTAIEQEFGNADLAFVIGGNSPYMLKTMAAHGTDKVLAEAVRKGLSLAGVSAGALLPFADFMSCPAKKPAEEMWEYEYLKGAGLIQAVATAHANQTDKHPDPHHRGTRLSFFRQTQFGEQTAPVGFAIDNGAALVIDSQRDTNQVYVGRSAAESTVHVLQSDIAGAFHEVATQDDSWLTELVTPLLVATIPDQS